MRIIVCLVLVALSGVVRAQIDSSLLVNTQPATDTGSLNMDAVYSRPFMSGGGLPVAIGGYVEANWQHLGTDGVSEGHQFQARRMTLFLSSTVGKQLKFLTEIEFEEGGREIAIEFAALDMEFHPMLNLRGGVILNPIGAFNQNHDGPKWEFTDRPVSATQLLPATWSNAGFGCYGKYSRKNWMFGYEAYVSGGFDNSIINNGENKTFLPAAKANPARFEETNSGQPLYTGKIAVRNRKVGEIGLSYMGGIYNRFEEDGLTIDKQRALHVFAVDANAEIPGWRTYLTGEYVWITVDVPATYTQQYGNRQQGGFMDIVQPIWKKPVLRWSKAVFNLACRFEYVDWNVGTFTETRGNVGQSLFSVMPGVSFRPNKETVFRWNYRIQQERDLFDNPPSNTRGFILGLSSYF